MIPVQTYIFGILTAVAVLVFIIFLLRKERLKERHAIWWILAGLVALGFSDGLPRSISDRFSATIDGVSYRSIGRMAMDQTVFELGDLSPSLGSEVHFFHDEFIII